MKGVFARMTAFPSFWAVSLPPGLVPQPSRMMSTTGFFAMEEAVTGVGRMGKAGFLPLAGGHGEVADLLEDDAVEFCNLGGV